MTSLFLIPSETLSMQVPRMESRTLSSSAYIKAAKLYSPMTLNMKIILGHSLNFSSSLLIYSSLATSRKSSTRINPNLLRFSAGIIDMYLFETSFSVLFLAAV